MNRALRPSKWATRVGLLSFAALSLSALNVYSAQTKAIDDLQSTSLSLYVVDDESPTAIILDIGEREIVIDGGTRADSLRAFLRHHPDVIDGPVELVVVTRASSGSWRGLQALLEHHRLLEFWEPGYHRAVLVENSSYLDFLAQLRKAVPPAHFKSPLEQFHAPAVESGDVHPFAISDLPGVQFTVLSSDDAPAAASGVSAVEGALIAASSSTPVILIQVGAFRLLVAGGIRGKNMEGQPIHVEEKLLALERQHPGLLKADILIVPDDGSEAASAQSFVDAVQPETAIFTASPTRKLPRDTVVARYSRIARVFSTGVHVESNRDHIACSIEVGEEKRHSCLYAATVNVATDRDEEPAWRGSDGKGRAIAAEDLLANQSSASAGQVWMWARADLSGAPLGGAQFASLDLSGADLSWANLAQADFTNAVMANVRIKFADVSGANFTGSVLSNVDFTTIRALKQVRQAKLVDAILAGVDLQDADLTDTDLTRADLRGALLPRELKGTVLTGARLQGADLANTVFELRPGAIPDPAEFAVASYLKTLRFVDSPHSLVELREALKRAGLREREREVTYAIERQRNRSRSLLSMWINWALFDATVQYGMRPDRALIILFYSILLFSVLYTLALHSRDSAGIWAVGLQEQGVDRGPIRVTADFSWRAAGDSTLARGVRSAFVALYFSVISAFQVGFRELHVGTWLSRIQPREYTLKATGWVRVVSGLQSLLSLYLLALWLLTYFGRPFE